MIVQGLKSPSLWCRWWGCTPFVPARGYYRGMPQAHCYDCGMRQYNAAKGCSDWSKPHDPTWWTALGHFLARWVDKFKAKGWL